MTTDPHDYDPESVDLKFNDKVGRSRTDKRVSPPRRRAEPWELAVIRNEMKVLIYRLLKAYKEDRSVTEHKQYLRSELEGAVSRVRRAIWR